MSEPVVSVKEARSLLGEDVVGMSDDEIIEIINTLDLLAKDALQEAKRRASMKKDAKGLAEIIYSECKTSKQKPSH